MRVLITGGAGFIGSHIADLLVDAGYEVRLLDSLLPAAHDHGSAPSYVNSAAELFRADLSDTAGLVRALSNVDVVFQDRKSVV